MKVYKSKYGLLAGTTYDGSKYFSGDKIFINIFFNHLAQKCKGEQLKRAKFFLCALDLLRNTWVEPDTIFKRENMNEMLHRFIGIKKVGQQFYVQVKQNKRTGRKDLMSVFPAK